jgi:hypothetical protein
MSALDQLVASWKEERIMLARQLQILGTAEMRVGTNVPGSLTQQNLKRTREWIAELDALIAEHSK